MKSKVLLSLLCLGGVSLLKAGLTPSEMTSLRRKSLDDRARAVAQRPELYIQASKEQRAELGLKAPGALTPTPAISKPTPAPQPDEQGPDWKAKYHEERRAHEATRNDANRMQNERDVAKEERDAAHAQHGVDTAGFTNEQIAGAAELLIQRSGVTPDMGARAQALAAQVSAGKQSHMLGRLGSSKKNKKRGFSLFGRRKHADA